MRAGRLTRAMDGGGREEGGERGVTGRGGARGDAVI